MKSYELKSEVYKFLYHIQEHAVQPYNTIWFIHMMSWSASLHANKCPPSVSSVQLALIHAFLSYRNDPLRW